MSGVDLHTHSTRSDGVLAPQAVVALAASAGVGGIALTDHDTTDGWDEASDACRRHGLRFVPGVELSTELGGRSVHLLGYWVDPGNDRLRTECDRLRNERLRRAEAMVGKLNALGLPLTFDEVLVQAGDAPIGRPHVAAAMVARGQVADLDAAFDGYLADGGPAYVPKHALAPERGVELIRQAGGVAVLAHPGVSTRDAPVDLALLDRLVAAGLAGVEADHAAHDDDARRYWREAAQQRNLYVTGASDFHGTSQDARLGEAVTPVDVVDALQQMSRTEGPW
ncbi:MAG TPA: PHP domain-containing protein [Egibacteraceae bacterium]|nr:PHP domain-containing protein [Egibacteraceae bacterium]